MSKQEPTVKCPYCDEEIAFVNVITKEKTKREIVRPTYYSSEELYRKRSCPECDHIITDEDFQQFREQINKNFDLLVESLVWLPPCESPYQYAAISREQWEYIRKSQGVGSDGLLKPKEHEGYYYITAKVPDLMEKYGGLLYEEHLVRSKDQNVIEVISLFYEVLPDEKAFEQ